MPPDDDVDSRVDIALMQTMLDCIFHWSNFHKQRKKTIGVRWKMKLLVNAKFIQVYFCEKLL